MKTKNCTKTGESGQALMVFTLFLGVALGFAALVFDVGFALQERTRLQSGVDAAALAGASALPDQGEAIARATEYAAKNGLDTSEATLTVTTPYNGDPAKIEVKVTSTQDTYFAKIFGMQVFNVSARGVATQYHEEGANAALLALNPTQCSAFNKGGGSTITINNEGGVMVNSTCNPSMSINGSGIVTAGRINYVRGAGYYQSGDQFQPTPTEVSQPIIDPLKDVPPPDLYAMTMSPDSGGTATNPNTQTYQNGVHTLRPGIYFGGLIIRSSANVTLLPGVYVMAGGGFQVQGGPTIIGTEVMIYNTFDPWKSTGAGACGAIDLSGYATWSYTPPSSGIYKGIGLWQDKACSTAVKLNGANGGPSGAIYAPSAMVNMAGSGALGSVQIIADTFDVQGSGNMTVDFYPWVSIPMDVSAKLIE